MNNYVSDSEPKSGKYSKYGALDLLLKNLSGIPTFQAVKIGQIYKAAAKRLAESKFLGNNFRNWSVVWNSGIVEK